MNEMTMLKLMEDVLTEEDIKYINDLERKYDIDDDLYSAINEIKLFFFKKGIKTGIDIIKYCEKQ